MTKAYAILNVKAASDSTGERIITGTATTPKLDRDGDILDPMGAEFNLPMPFLWQHNHDEPIGWVEQATKTKNGIDVTIRIADLSQEVGTQASKLKYMIDDAWLAIKSGLVTGLSVGFALKEFDWLENGGLHIKSWDFYELSAVTIPANPDGKITNIKQIKKAFADSASQPVAFDEVDDETLPQQEPTTDAPVSDVTEQQTYVNLIDPNKGGVRLL